MKDADDKLDAQVKVNADGLGAEITNRTNADNTLQSNIDSEAATRLSNDNTLQSNIDSEESSRIAADGAIQSELDATQAGAGLNVDGTYTANASSNFIAAATSMKDADDKMDAQIKVNTDGLAAEVTNRTNADSTLQSNIDSEAATRLANDNTLQSNIDAEETSRIAADAGIQSELDATQVGAGLGADGSYTANGASNYISAATSMKDADDKLDAQVKVNADGLAAEIVNRGNADSAIQSELDATQAGAGLEVDGSYVANGASNFISAATSMKDADNKMDAQIKVNTDGLAAEVTDRTNADSALQSELDQTQTGAGLGVGGIYSANGASNYVSSATSLKDADDKLDAQIKVNADAIAANNNSIRNDINAQIYTEETNVAALTHTISHNLDASFINYSVMIKGDDNKWHNDIVAITETDSNTLTVELTESRNIKVAIREMANL